MPAQSSPLAQSLLAMSSFVTGDATLQETLQRVAELGLNALPGADLAGITMLLEGMPRTAVFTDSEAPEIDAAQYETGMGPCLDAYRHRQVYRVDDVNQDLQWPGFSEVAAAHGVRSVMSIPLVARHEGVGALNFYSRNVAAFSHEDVEVGIAFATEAAILLVTSQAFWDERLLAKSLDGAMAAGTAIEQAKGILMNVHGCSADEALQILVRASQRDNRELPEVAQELVARTSSGTAVRGGRAQASHDESRDQLGGA